MISKIFSLRLSREHHLRTLVVFIAILLTVFKAHGQNHWTWRSPLPQGNNLNEVIHTDGGFIAVGNSGAFLTSSDGVSWTQQAVGVGAHLHAVAKADGLIVAVGENGSVTRSENGTNWSLGNSGTGEPLRGITFGKGMFVAVGGASDGVILTSTDGLHWTSRVSQVYRPFHGVAYGNGVFVAVGQNNLIYRSTDGLTWVSLRDSENVNYLNTVIFSDGQFVAAGFSGVILTSPDGTTWTTRTSNTNQTITALAHGGGTFTGVTTEGSALFSDDGVTWSVQAAPGGSLREWYGVAAQGSTGLLVLVGGNGAILSTPDGQAWTFRGSWPLMPRAAASGNGLHVGVTALYTATAATPGLWTFHRQSVTFLDIAFGNGTFVAVSNTAIYTSSDGIHWTRRLTGLTYTNKGHTVEFSGGRFIVTAERQVAISADGANWTVSSPALGNLLFGATFGNGTFVAVGGASNTSEIYSSTNGVNWTARATSATSGFTDVTYGNGLFVAVGHGGKIYTSPDAIVWTSRASGVSAYLTRATWGQGMFVVSGPAGLLLTSPDGIIWTNRALPMRDDLDVSFNGSEFFNWNGRIVKSSDGIAWTFLTPPHPGDFQDVTYGDGLFVAAARATNSLIGSTIVTSPDGIVWTARATCNFWLTSISYANGIYFAGGENGRLLTSPDAIHWTERVSNGTRSLRRFAYGNGLFVAVGGSYNQVELLTSPDGITWTPRNPAAAEYELHDITFAEGLFVAVGGDYNSRTIVTSPDGLEWTKRTFTSGPTSISGLLGISYSNGLFVAVGGYGIIATSTNGTDWQAQVVESSWFTDELTGITFAEGNFVALRRYTGEILTSEDGSNWLRRSTSIPAGGTAITFGSDMLVVVGSNSAILTSTIEPPPPAPASLTAKAVSSRGVALTWQDTDGEAGYRIERRSEPSGAWWEIAPSIPANSTTFEDFTLNPGVTYSYRIRAAHSSGTSPYSQIASVRTFTASEQWRKDYFGTIADTGLSADTADPDGDGALNLLERAFVLDPLEPTQSGMPEITRIGDPIRVVFTRDSGNGDLVYEVELSDDLETWSVIARSSAGRPIQNVGVGASSSLDESIGGTLYRVTVNAYTTPKTRRFLRVKVRRE